MYNTHRALALTPVILQSVTGGGWQPAESKAGLKGNYDNQTILMIEWLVRLQGENGEIRIKKQDWAPSMT